MVETSIILAAGDQKRWVQSGGQGCKQLVDVGKPLIERIQQHFGGFVVTDNLDIIKHSEYVINPVYNETLAHSLESSRYYWGSMVTVLLGDVYYTDELVEQIKQTKQTTFFGDERDIFAFKFMPSNYVNYCIEVAKKKEGKLWDIYRAYIFPQKFTDFPNFEKVIAWDFDILQDYERFIVSRKQA